MSADPPKSTHSQILKSSALIGGSALVNVLVSMIRVKFTAVYLGPLGVGLFGAYNTILGPVAMLAGMGISASGVRQIAEAAGEGNQVTIARALVTVRRTALITGGLGMLLMLALAYPLSLSTFGNSEQFFPLCILSVTILLGSVAGGLGAIIQGLRRIRDMAAQGIVGALLGLPIAIPMMMLWGVESIVPMMVISALVGLVITYWFVRRVEVVPVQMSWRETWTEAKPLLKLGFVLMSTGLMGAGVAYLTRVMIIRKLGLEANGLYSSAWMLSNYYVGFILGAMIADFFPRLAEVNKNNSEVNRLVNEQTEVGMLMALPGVLATLTLAPLVIHLFYTAKFLPAVEVLQWQVLGVMLRVISWPMGFIMLAKGAKRMFMCTEVLANVVLLGLTWLGILLFGLAGSGMAFMGMYLFYVLLMLMVSGRMTGFAWSRANCSLIVLTVVLSAVAFLLSRQLSLVVGAVIGVVLAGSTAWYCLRSLTRLVGRNPLATGWDKLKKLIPFQDKTSP